MNQQTNNSDLMVSGPALHNINIESLPDKEPEKKKGKAGKVILTIFIVLLCIVLLIALAAGILGYCALKDNMPAPPEGESVEMSEIISGAAKEVLSEKTITLEANQINTILDTLKTKLNESTDDYSINELFIVIADSSATVYARVDTEVLGKTITLPAQLQLGVFFDDASTSIGIDIQRVACGTITVPESVVDTALTAAASSLPESMRVENGFIYYDVSNLDELIDQEIENQIGMSGSWLGDLLTSAIQNAVDVQLTGAKIENNKLIIEGSVI